MQSSQFGHGRVSMQQSRIDPGTFRQASVMTGANPVSPSRESFQSTNRQVNPSSIPSRSSGSQHFFSSSARQNSSVQTGRSGSNFSGSENLGGNTSHGPASGQMSRQSPGSNQSSNQTSNQGQRGFNSPSSPSGQQGQPIQSSRPNWHPFTPPSGQQTQSNAGRTFEGQGGTQSQSRSNVPQASQPPRQVQNNSRGGFTVGGSSRPTLNMQQPVVTPRGGGSYSGRPMPSAPSGGNGGYRGGPPSGGGSYSSRPTPSAPSGGGYHGAPPSGGSHGGNSGGGSHGGSSSGGHGNGHH